MGVLDEVRCGEEVEEATEESDAAANAGVDAGGPLGGVVAFVSVFNDDDIEATEVFERRLRALGARCVKSVAQSVTHCVLKNAREAARSRAYMAARDDAQRALVVGPSWVAACEAEGRRALENKFITWFTGDPYSGYGFSGTLVTRPPGSRQRRSPAVGSATPAAGSTGASSRKRRRSMDVVSTVDVDVDDPVFSSSQQLMGLFDEAGRPAGLGRTVSLPSPGPKGRAPRPPSRFAPQGDTPQAVGDGPDRVLEDDTQDVPEGAFPGEGDVEGTLSRIQMWAEECRHSTKKIDQEKKEVDSRWEMDLDTCEGPIRSKTPAKERGGSSKPPAPPPIAGSGEVDGDAMEPPPPRPTLVIASSSLTAANEAKLKGTLKSLKGAKVLKTGKENASVGARPFEGSHLVVGEPRRTAKLYAAIAAGAWVVSIAWVEASLKAGHWVDEEDFELKDAFPGASLSRMLHRERETNPSSKSPLEGVSVYVPLDSDVPRAALKLWLRMAGAEVMDSAELAKQNPKHDSDGRRVLLAGKLSTRKARDEGVEVVSEKWALEAIVTWSCPTVSGFST